MFGKQKEEDIQRDGDRAMPDMDKAGGFYDSPMNAFGNSIVLLTNPKDDIFDIECDFRNISYDEESGQLRQIGKPLMNDYGIKQTIGLMRGVVNKNTPWSWVEDKEEVNAGRNYLAFTLGKDLMRNRETYAILDDSVRDRIYCVCVEFVHFTLKRAFRQGERNFWRSTQSNVRHEVINEDKNKGILGRWRT